MRYEVYVEYNSEKNQDVVLLCLVSGIYPLVEVNPTETTGKGKIQSILAMDSPETLKDYLIDGCNLYVEGQERSWPLGVWTKEDISEFFKTMYGGEKSRGSKIS